MPSNALSIEWGEDALNDVNEMVNFISEFNPPAAKALVDQIEKSVDRLPTFPFSYRTGRVAGTREMPVGKHIVIYSVSETEVLVLRVLHSAQQWP
ncbi:type II toxin-antitoxin system RelE/ParE family toxin (plasmid) [Rhizobium lusitanum]|uniref:type II toxin-antitoxin system RelE/ParE family toxin n=1 Tax=Rhizobium lusitanum TaxID=293958 RepID=UPI001610AF11|nr:type II toxin-antitoxin system RelE/ParE family toxin [Rhizobium lusitanum]QND44661.1 type II toxin-antitoxin system RelE/ParE family toxin [Rhizobium lusitanum]